ncbi:serine/threonine protein phosphatase [Tenacibaculum sp. SZ-18]|uniref:metallophosphoesterase n=1 Tax=Tenacibaculum sp. SZ-18 TaxID=754423 RepID=UPI000C2D53B5|nr:metallophosphoesterase [Tenacibaculum sp. SZ-18]AUC16360.1 serine/threonine protein phosphatase [Tenacibaculum sp. SZ-18]
MSSKKRITRAFNNAKTLPLTESSKYIMFSDCHRGDNSFADDFARNRNIFNYALSQYFIEDYTYIELGDGDELWENKFDTIFQENKDVYLLLKKFYDTNRLHFIWGNHDMVYKNPKTINKNLAYYFEDALGKELELMPNASFSESILLKNEQTKQSLFLIHGHQADWFNYNFWRLSRFLVRFLWKPLQILGIKDPTSPAKNFRELIKVEQRIEKWIKSNQNQIIITGHTHRPRFPQPDEVPFFNDGSCVHPRCITGLEIENYQITLIKWHLVTQENGTMKIIKTILEGPKNIEEYQ